MRKKDKLTISILAIFAIGLAGLWGVDFSSQYLTVSDIDSTLINQPVEITGNVKALNQDRTAFILTDDVSDIEVNYKGDLVPQLCNGAKVSVRGVLISEDLIEANFLVMGCPSKYESQIEE